jgi:hypothetical protein
METRYHPAVQQHFPSLNPSIFFIMINKFPSHHYEVLQDNPGASEHL